MKNRKLSIISICNIIVNITTYNQFAYIEDPLPLEFEMAKYIHKMNASCKKCVGINKNKQCRTCESVNTLSNIFYLLLCGFCMENPLD